MWRHYPWLIGLFLSPLLYGSVNIEGQVIVALLAAISLALLSGKRGKSDRQLPPSWLKWIILLLLLLPLVPLPVSLISWVAPYRADLARNFPLEAGLSPQWTSLSVAPAGTVQRLWEILLIVSFFVLARSGLREPGFALHLAAMVTSTAFILAMSDVWLRTSGSQSILGLWANQWNYAAGTFANRNHFADWMYVAILFLFGYVMRTQKPLHRARTELFGGRNRSLFKTIVIALALGFGLFMAVISGSRAGFFAFGVGLFVWIAILAVRSRSHARWIQIGLGIFVTCLIILAASEFLFTRLTTFRAELPYKMQIWWQAFKMGCGFPVFGTGMGSFVTAFSHFKSMADDKVVWHVENEFVQVFVETGLAGLLAIAFLLFFLSKRIVIFAVRERMPEPELCFGAIAGLAAFLFHGVFEFVFQIPANAILAATLFGFLVGMLDFDKRPEVAAPPGNLRLIANWAFAGLLFVLALVQGLAWWHWQKAQEMRDPKMFSQQVERSLHWWPFDSRRYMAMARAQIDQIVSLPRAKQRVGAELARTTLNRALAWDPYNWELRLERAWVDIAFSTNAVTARYEAWEAIRLNPREARIPLRFARHYAQRDAVLTMAFLRQLDLTDPGLLRTALEIAWPCDPQPATLWALTPDVSRSLLVMGDFAADKRLFSLATQAYLMATNQVDPVDLARRFVRVQQPRLALNILPQTPPDPPTLVVMAQAFVDLGRFSEATRHLETLWSGPYWRKKLEMPFPVPEDAVSHRVEREHSLVTLQAAWKANPTNSFYGQQLAEFIFQQSATNRNTALLLQLDKQFPGQPRFLWMAFYTEKELGRPEQTAHMALLLADRIQTLGW